MTAEQQDGQPLRRRDSSTSSKPKHPRGGPQTAPAEIILTPAQYLDTITLPTVAEFLDDLGNPRRAYLACMVTAHLVDQVTPGPQGLQGAGWSAAGHAGPVSLVERRQGRRRTGYPRGCAITRSYSSSAT